MATLERRGATTPQQLCGQAPLTPDGQGGVRPAGPPGGFQGAVQGLWANLDGLQHGTQWGQHLQVLNQCAQVPHRLKSATAVLKKGFVGQGSKVVQTNLPKLRLQIKELDKAANNT